ncbi:hypothetical protein ACN6K6_004721 [Streptomyces violaceoruber]|uniref:hypothetical protein n=1 Tax=Streptomyces violaceoruber TaxID=1935 RepID=UPI00403CF0FB
MALQPVEATLIGAAVGALAATSVALLTHLLTRGRDRAFRVWERRMDTYQEVLRTRDVLARHRAELLRSQSESADFPDPDRVLNAIFLSRIQLDMFGSPGIKTVEMFAWVAFNHWHSALSEWRQLHARARAHFNNQEMYDAADRKWKEVKDLAKTVDLMDQRLAEAIRAEAKFEEYARSKWRERALKGLRHASPREIKRRHKQKPPETRRP